MTKAQCEVAHTHSSRHREEIRNSRNAGCFYCQAVFPVTEIARWIDDDDTALCPQCGIDAVIGDKSGYTLSPEFLKDMFLFWFKPKR